MTLPGHSARSSIPSIRLRPTAPGVFWLLAILALLASAINYGNNLIFALAFLLLALWLQTAWQCRRHLRRLVWRGNVPVAVFAGETLVVDGRVGNGHADAWVTLAADSRSGPPADFDPQGETTASLALPAGTRGACRIAGLRLVSRWPFGLWQASRPLPAARALVYPHPAGEQPLPTSDPRHAHRQAATDDYQGLRAYAPGDAPRRINWRVYGRSGELAVNRFDGGSGGDALRLDWERTAGDVETRLSQLTAWLLAAEQAGSEYALRLPGFARPPGHGAGQRSACLEALALFSPAPSSPTTASAAS